MEKENQLIEQIKKELNLKYEQVKNVITLLDQGNTIPFIARYRKELTGELDEIMIKTIFEKINYLRNLEENKEKTLRLIAEQGKLTPELEEQIRKAKELQEIEDIYRPFRPKRKTRASVAKEKGLEPFAIYLLENRLLKEVISEAKKYLNVETNLNSSEEVIAGAKDIIAEQIADDPNVRTWLRKETEKSGIIEVKAKDEEKNSVYEMYYDYQEEVKFIRPHRVLAINRGEKEEFLKVKITVDEQRLIAGISKKFLPLKKYDYLEEYLTSTIEDSYHRLLAPAIEREVRQLLTEKAEEQAIKVFSANLQQLLLQPPVKEKIVLGIDPAYRTGCKLAVVNSIGKVEYIGVIYPTPPQNKIEEGKKVLNELVKRFGVELIAIGNGTASKETEQFVVDFIKEYQPHLSYIIVSEAGASVYSASPIAREEFPELDVAERSAISIARRLQDPLAELVKIEPKAIGVGQYQHDVSQKELDNSLTFVVESAVNKVGVDVNTASISLLQYVSGLNKTVAKNIVKIREEKGRFRKREELKQIPRFGEKTYEQAIGFLRVDGENPLDKTAIHPESYDITYKLLANIGLRSEDIGTKELIERLSNIDPNELAAKLNVGVPTLTDIIDNLMRPLRDPRDELPKPIFRQDILKMEDLKQGMKLKGTVRNIVDFGVFVDIGVKEDGLIHLSELSNQYIKHPFEVVNVGDIIEVTVLNVDLAKKRISLSLKR